MAKRFVEVDEFWKELKNVKMDLNGNIDELYERVEHIKDAVNMNADNGEELEKRVNELCKRVEGLQRASKGLRVDVDAKNSNGVVLASLVGVFGFVGFVWLMNEIGKLENQLKKLTSVDKDKCAKAQPVNDIPVEVTFREDGTYSGPHAPDGVTFTPVETTTTYNPKED